MVNIIGNHDGSLRGRLHRQPGHRLPVGHRPAQPRRSRSTTCCRRGTRSPGMLAAAGLLAAERHRTRTGEGQLRAARALRRGVLRWSATSARSPRSQVNRHERPKDGNYLYGAFGRDFLTKDGRRVMIVALTPRQWQGAGRGDRPRRGVRHDRASCMDVDLDEEGDRFAAREVIGAMLQAVGAQPARWTRSARCFDAPRRVAGARTRPSPQLVEEDPRCSTDEPDVRRGRAAGHRHLPDAGLAAATSPTPGACRADARPAARRAHRRGPRRGARAQRRRDRPAARRRRRRRARSGPAPPDTRPHGRRNAQRQEGRSATARNPGIDWYSAWFREFRRVPGFAIACPIAAVCWRNGRRSWASNGRLDAARAQRGAQAAGAETAGGGGPGGRRAGCAGDRGGSADPTAGGSGPDRRGGPRADLRADDAARPDSCADGDSEHRAGADHGAGADSRADAGAERRRLLRRAGRRGEVRSAGASTATRRTWTATATGWPASTCPGADARRRHVWCAPTTRCRLGPGRRTHLPSRRGTGLRWGGRRRRDLNPRGVLSPTRLAGRRSGVPYGVPVLPQA